MGHVASSCFKLRDIFGSSKKGQPNSSKSSTSGFIANWVLDTGATHHITNDSSSLGNHVPYNGQNSILVGNGTKIHISSVGTTFLPVNNHSLVLKDVLHASRVASNLIYVHKLCKDNNIFVGFHSFFFYVKDTHMRKVLLRGPILI